ncbi:MAG: hypothetical protein GXY80_06500 [Syntrophorhabdus aromaticivorans]|uniref:Uncharacterized protein n=1 Tax=Syntrophorhabdus aromaticivorans TaxID=328301 RepID=A0A971S101_9BACT|nr:hypothetical protein [Syntrophorhabdus aromaticivorans]
MFKILFLLVFLPCSVHAFWPLSWEYNEENHYFGPFISYQNKDDTTRVTFRPLLASYDSDEDEEGVLDFLYPLGRVKKDESYFIPIYRSKRHGEEWDTSFALFFWGKSRQGGYGGFFPFYGKLYNRFAADEMGFLMWPLYSYTRDEDATKTNVLTPFFSFYGGAESGFQVWPFYGKREREGVRSSGFFMWPVFIWEKKDLDMDEPIESFYAFPFYLRTTSETKAYYHVMWPLFSYMRDKDKTEWSLLGGLFSKTEGKEKSGFNLLPLVGYKKKDRDTTFDLLWPLYQESEWYVSEERYFRRRVAVINRYMDEPDRRFLNIWPFFEYSAVKEDYTFRFPSLLPFRVDGLDRIIKPLVTVYEERRSGEKRMVNLLYGLFTKEVEGEDWKARFAFLLEVKKDENGVGFEILSGLFGLDGKYLKVLFIPIKRN